MKTMYSTKPVDGATEVSKGVYALPVHTYQQKAMQALGWVYHERQLRQEEVPEEPQGQVDDVLEEARALYKEKFGKNPHKNMKAETILEKLKDD